MKRKRTVLFSDYTVPPATPEQKDACVKAALDSAATVVRGETLVDQVRTQLGYIGPWLWIGVAAVVVVLLCLYSQIILVSATQTEAMFAMLALLSTAGPVIASLSAPILARSYANDMWELEEAAFYNLPRLTALRLFICALAVLPAAAVLLALGAGVTGAVQGLTVLIAPFLLASGLNYVILGHLRGVAGSFCCIGAGLVLAVLCPSLFLMTDHLMLLPQGYEAAVLPIIVISACALFFVLSARHYIRKPPITQ